MKLIFDRPLLRRSNLWMRTPDHLFDGDFLRNLPENSEEAMVVLINEFLEEVNVVLADKSRGNQVDPSLLPIFLRWRVMIWEFSKRRAPDLGLDLNGVVDNPGAVLEQLKAVKDFAHNRIHARLITDTHVSLSELYGRKLDGLPTGQLSANEKVALQQRINELRDAIAKSEILDDDHKLRVTKRLNAMQAEFDKPIPDLDRLMGQVTRIGFALWKIRPLFHMAVNLSYGLSLPGFAYSGLPAPPPPSTWKTLPTPAATEESKK